MKKSQTIGIDLGGTNVRIGLIEGEEIIKIISKKISSNETEDFIINEIADSIFELFNKNVSGIGIGVPSIVDIEKGIVYEVHNIPSWRKVYLKDIFEKIFNVPTNVNNDVNCFVLGEKHFGKGKGYQNIVGLAMGTGLGGGIIANGKLYSGKNGGAGEFGLMQYLDKNYEYYCSGQFFKGKFNLNGEDILRKAKNSDKKALKIFDEFGEHMGNLLNSIMYALNPELILLGGSVSSSYSFFRESMFNSLKKHEFKVQLSQVKIQKSTLKHSAVLGAAKLIS
ncbi:MAG: ROK family protein [Ignavibacteriales bacterium]|nr:ROK family protein [Ignavibacteriales bacterium]MCB9218252.1 ROK family protein [Ignavibacteriales bacterium]MCB9260547.1 ROK family protein [Ignavibacteriales bacterium]